MSLGTRHRGYYAFALGSAMLIFFGIVWGPDIGLWFTLISTAPSLPAGFYTSVKLFSLALSDSSFVLTGFYLATALLVGANLALLAFYAKKYRAMPGAGSVGTSSLAALVTLLGFGCASCGTLFLSFLLTSLGGTGLAVIPADERFVWALRGAGLALLAFSLWRLAKHANEPLVCSVE